MIFLDDSNLVHDDSFCGVGLSNGQAMTSQQSPRSTNSPSSFFSTADAPHSLPRKIAKPESYHFRRREKLVTKPDELWSIEQGFIRAITWDDQGNVITVGLWGKGELVGSPLGVINPYELHCVTAAKVKLNRLNQGYPYEFLLNQVQQSQELLSLFRSRCVKTRLLNILWWLADRFGRKVTAGQFIGIPLTHQELADLVGSTRVTITRMLQELEMIGQLQRVNRQILLKQSSGKEMTLGE
jgi:CRP-like cAMP-binding protein